MTETLNPLAAAFTADWLMDQQFPPVTYAVDGIVPEGMTILVAPPKLGKSWLVLDIALHVSAGARVLGAIEVDWRPVLYLALEDGQRRLQNRLQTLGCGIGSPDLTFLVQLEADPLETIWTYLEQHKDRSPLVIVDTLGKIKGQYNGKDAYGHDYAQAAALKNLVDNVPGSSMLVVHHTNKGEKSDFVDSVSGTHGIAGAADTILTLSRDRHSGSGTLNVTSRDAAEGQYAVTFNEGKWTLDGTNLAQAAQAAENREATAGVGDDMVTIIETVNKHPQGISRAEIITATGISSGKVDTYLTRAVERERIARAGRGKYTPVVSVRSVRFGEEEDPKLTHLSLTTQVGESA